MLDKLTKIWWDLVVLWEMRKVIFWKLLYMLNPSIGNSARFQKAIKDFLTHIESDESVSEETVQYAAEMLYNWI